MMEDELGPLLFSSYDQILICTNGDPRDDPCSLELRCSSARRPAAWDDDGMLFGTPERERRYLESTPRLEEWKQQGCETNNTLRERRYLEGTSQIERMEIARL